MLLDERVRIVAGVGEECTTKEELLELLRSKENAVAYDGFEPSGRMHIAQGLVKTLHVNKLTSCGVEFVFWIADWFALMNNKMDGDLEKIRDVGRYMIEIWKATGMDMDKVQFLWSSEEILKRPDEYWKLVLDIGRRNSLSRILRCTQIMGRTATDNLSAAQIFYPVMQCADIFFIGADICQLGMDQRKVNMLAREYSAAIRRTPPIVISHHMLMGLAEGQEKMSKSLPESAIFMDDSEADVAAKIKKAFCPPREVEKNPILDYYKHLVFPSFPVVTIERKEKHGGNISYQEYSRFQDDYVGSVLHPDDVKSTLVKIVNRLIQPVRDHFRTDPDARKLLERVKSFSKPR